jgi:NAD(P)-dependent dehydrogenase (short-subunit alcohol dehydrogenase family)
MREAKTALVLGATGGIGGETAAALLRHGRAAAQGTLWKAALMASSTSSLIIGT